MVLGPFGRISREPQDLLFFDLNAARHSGEARGKAVMKGPLQTATKETSYHMCRWQNKGQVHILTPGNWERDLILHGVIKLSSWDDLGLSGWVLHPMPIVPIRDGRGKAV